MNEGKYIIKEVRGHEAAICFDSLIEHCDMIQGSEKVIAAGFFYVAARTGRCEIKVTAFGESVSLKIKSRGETDAQKIHKILREPY